MDDSQQQNSQNTPDPAVLLQQILGNPPPPSTPQVSVPQKEVLLSSDGGQGEKVPLVELREEEKIPEDVQGWVEKVQQDVALPEPIQNHGEVVMAEPPVTFVDDKIVVPMTQQAFHQGFKKKATESARWLTEWCKRIMLMFGDRAKFKSE